MRELTIGKNDAGQRLDRFLSKALPLLPRHRPAPLRNKNLLQLNRNRKLRQLQPLKLNLKASLLRTTLMSTQRRLSVA